MDEKELARLCREGDSTAQQELYRRCAPMLMGVCRRYASDSGMAEDMLHDGFIKIFKSIGKFEYRGPGSLPGWCRRLMVNSAVDRLRREKRSGISFSDKLPDSVVDPQENTVRKVPPEVLQAFISELPPGYRTVFNLSVFDGMSHREIAVLLGIRENSSSSQFARAKKILATKINKWLEDAGQ